MTRSLVVLRIVSRAAENGSTVRQHSDVERRGDPEIESQSLHTL